MSASLLSNSGDIAAGSTILGFPDGSPSGQAAQSTTAAPVTNRSIPVSKVASLEQVRKPTLLRTAPREFAYRLSLMLFLGDWMVALTAIFCGLAVREWQRGASLLDLERWSVLRSNIVLWSVGGSAVFAWLMVMLRTYDVANIYRLNRTMKNLARSVMMWAVGMWACIGLFRLEGYTPRMGVIYCMVTMTILLGTWRMFSFVLLINPRIKRAASSRTVVVGWNEQASHLREAMRMDLSQLGEIVGCVPVPGGRFGMKPPSDLAVLGDYSALPAIVKECGVNSVVLAELSSSAKEIQHLIAFCQREMMGFQMIPDYFPALNSGLQIQTVSGVPLLGVSHLRLDRTLNRAIKRTIDIVGSIVGLAISALIIPWFCAIVYLESPGSVIYRQRRMSRSGRTFFIYKIRSMRMNAEGGTGAVWAKKEDPRRLRIGTFMRKYNIDELPQFWNVLKGDMSLVGPRPERPELIEKFKDEIPNYNARHEVRAGLTGWAQVNGLRGDTDLRQRIEADLYYLENWSVMLDLYCLFATCFKTKNAH